MNGLSWTTFRARISVAALLTSCVWLSPFCFAGELSIKVTGLSAPFGNVGCSLFTGEEGFPMDNSKARSEWVAAAGETVTCRFKDVAPGKYAVSVGHDVNGNQKVDTNFFGIPTEQWGVSNNVRPMLRAPRFNEAVFTIPADLPSYAMEIKVAK